MAQGRAKKPHAPAGDCDDVKNAREVPAKESAAAHLGPGPAHWLVEAHGFEPVKARMPLGEFLLEATQVAALIDGQLARKVAQDGVEQGGGESSVNIREVMRLSELSLEVGREIREIAAAIVELDGRLSSIPNQSENPELERALADRATLNRALNFLFETTNNEHGKEVLRRLRDHHPGRTQSAVAASLIDYSVLASKFADELATLGVERHVFNDAPGVAHALQRRRARGSLTRKQRKELTTSRNRLCALLSHKVTQTRRVLRFALHDQPELLAQVASNYVRKRQQRYRERRGG